MTRVDRHRGLGSRCVLATVLLGAMLTVPSCKDQAPPESDAEVAEADPSSQVKNAVVAMEMKQYPQAIALLQMSDRAQPDNPLVHFNLGVCYKMTERPDLAVVHYEKAIELDDSAEAHLHLGQMLVEQGRAEDARFHLERAAARASDDYEMVRLAALALMSSGSLRPALVAFERAARLQPKDAQLYNNWGAALLQLDRFEDAMVRLETALRLAPEYATAHVNLAVALEQLGRNDEAIEHYREAAAIDPASPAHEQLARLRP